MATKRPPTGRRRMVSCIADVLQSELQEWLTIAPSTIAPYRSPNTSVLNCPSIRSEAADLGLAALESTSSDYRTGFAQESNHQMPRDMEADLHRSQGSPGGRRRPLKM